MPATTPPQEAAAAVSVSATEMNDQGFHSQQLSGITMPCWPTLTCNMPRAASCVLRKTANLAKLWPNMG